MAARTCRWSSIPVLPVLLLAAGLAACGSLQTQDAGPPRATESSTGVLELEYGDEGDRMSLCRPPGTDPAPVVVLLHGVTDDPSPEEHPQMLEWCSRLAEKGLAVAVPGYDPVVEGSQEARDQVAAAVAELRSTAEESRIDADRIALVGFSGGGQEWVRAAFDPRNGPVRALVGMYAVVEPIDGTPTGAGSLSARLRRHRVPTLLAVGAADVAPHVRESVELFRARSSGLEVTILEHAEAGHAFDLEPRDRRAEQIVAAVDDFLVRNLTR